jgi:cytochrome c
LRTHAIAPLAVLVLMSCTTGNVPRTATRDAVRSYVENAAEIVARDGAAACDALRTPQWFSGDWYIFVSVLDGPVVCHPARPDLVGTIERKLVDPQGKAFGEEIYQLASGPDRSGWVDYVWPRPGSTEPVAKSAYIRAVTGPDGRTYVVGSGGYELR